MRLWLVLVLVFSIGCSEPERDVDDVADLGRDGANEMDDSPDTPEIAERPDIVECRPVASKPTGDLSVDLVGDWVFNLGLIDSLQPVYRLQPNGEMKVVLSPHDGFSESPRDGRINMGSWQTSGGFLKAGHFRQEVLHVWPTMIQLDQNNMLRVECTGFGFNDTFERDEAVCSTACTEMAEGALCIPSPLPHGRASGCGLPDLVQPRRIQGLDFGFQTVAYAGNQWCGLKTTGEVACENDSYIPSGEFVQMTAGHEFYCAIDIRGEVTCWNPSRDLRTPSIEFKDIKANFAQACGVDSEGDVYCWYPGTPDNQPGDPILTGDFERVFMGDGNLCALDNDGVLTCIGPDAPQIAGVYKSAAVKSGAVCAIDAANNVSCVGSDTDDVPQTAQLLAFQDDGGCALSPENVLTCWGPYPFTAENVTQFSTMLNNGVCGIISNNVLVCW